MKKLFFVLALFAVFISTKALGITINFGDNTIHWAGWASTQASDNTADQIGVPIFPGTPALPGFSTGSYTINDTTGKLERVTFNYQLNGAGFESYIKPVDLFIDKEGDHIWDYVVQVYGIGSGAENYNLYSISLNSAGGTPGYILSDTAWAASAPNPGSYNIRNNHPVAINGNISKTLLQTVYFDGWKSGSGSHTTYFNFGSGVDIGPGLFEFAWTVNCANDVVREHGNNPVPEPATMLLLGSGLLGLAGLARKRLKR